MKTKSSSKFSRFFNKIRRISSCIKPKRYYRYHRLRDDDDDSVGIAKTDIDEETPRIYVSVYVGKESKRYDVPLMYLSLPRFQQMVVRSSAQGNINDLDRPIIVDCNPETFELLLKLWSYKWDVDEGNCFFFMKNLENKSRFETYECLSSTTNAATRSSSGE